AENWNDARRVGATGLVAARVGSVEKRLVGEVELGRPGRHKSAREFLPTLIEEACGRNAPEGKPGPARKFLKALLVVGKAQPTCQFKFGCELIINLAKSGPRIHPVRIYAEKIIMSLSVDVAERIGVDIRAPQSKERLVQIGGIGLEWTADIGQHGIEGDVLSVAGIGSAEKCIDLFRKKTEGVEEDIVVFQNVIMHVIAACDEVQRPFEIRTHAQLVVKLFRIFA